MAQKDPVLEALTANGFDGTKLKDQLYMFSSEKSKETTKPEPSTESTLTFTGDDRMGYRGYYAIVSGDAEAKSSGDTTKKAGGVTRISGKVAGGNKDEYTFTGDLLHVTFDRHLEWHMLDPEKVSNGEVDYTDSPGAVLVDGKEIDPGSFDPPIPHGRVSQDELPEWATYSEDDCDIVARTNEEFKQAKNDLQDGQTLGIADGFKLDDGSGVQIEFPQNDITFAWLPNENGYAPKLKRPTAGNYGWSNTQILLSGDNVGVFSPTLEGEPSTASEYKEYSMIKGLEMTGKNPVVVNGWAQYWTFAAFYCNGTGEVLLGGRAKNNRQDGLGYGVAFSGPLGQDPWTPEEVANNIHEWHERGTVYHFDLNNCRHHIESGTNASYEAAFCISESATEHGGHHLDVHRPGGDLVVHRDGVALAPESDSVEKMKLRGWAETAHVIEGMWFENGEELNDNRTGSQSVKQVCASSDNMRLERGQWDESSGEWKNVYWRNLRYDAQRPDSVPSSID